MPGKQGLHEVRTRVICHLPVNDSREEKAFFKLLEYLDSLHDLDIGVSGYTHSEIRPVVFHGYWWPNSGDKPIHDQIVVCSVDYLLSTGSPELSEKVAELKATIRRLYRYYRSPQDEVWVIAHPIVRQD